jgi:ubiquinone/menaquinone biosynthesis C-methylase UbiE
MKWIYRHPAVYDVVDTMCSLSLADRVRHKVLGGVSADSVLEIGAGSGKNFSLVDSPLAMGLDRSASMLHHARRRFPAMRPLIGDAHMLPFRDACVGVAIFSYCLRGLARPGAAVKEALRVASEVVIMDYNCPRFMPRAVWEMVLNRFGWRVFGSRDVDYAALERLGRSCRSTDLYGGLYRVLVLKGAGNAES